MESLDLALIIQELEFEDPLEEELVGELKLWACDLALVNNADPNDQLAVV
jgi:hypothetical protein